MMLFAQSSPTDAAGGAAAFVLFVLLLLLGIAMYFLPSIVGFVRKVPNAVSILIINFFLGWTLIGWVVSLAMAFRDQQQPVVINQIMPNVTQPPLQPPNQLPPRNPNDPY